MKLESLIEEAEQHLIVTSYEDAETSARDALQRSLYLQNVVELQDRACVVLIQALYETGRFASCAAQLQGYWGTLDATPPTSLLLWLSLALDSSNRAEAERLIPQLLQSKRPETGNGWPSRHYLALAHLHLFEVLLPGSGGAAGAVQWLESTQLPIGEEEKQALKSELLQQAQQAQQLSNGASPANAQANPQQPALTVRTSVQQQQQEQQQGAKLRGRQEEACRAEPSQNGNASSSGIAAERDSEQLGTARRAGTHAPNSWAAAGAAAYERLASAAAATRSYVGSWAGWHPAEPGSREQGEGGGGNTVALPSGSVVAGTVVGAVLLYALYSERQAISRRAAKARRATAQALSEVLRMALSVNPNPNAAR